MKSETKKPRETTPITREDLVRWLATFGAFVVGFFAIYGVLVLLIRYGW